ncbi:hypothetical protein D3C84_1116880 [compost metagenome]
MSGEQTDQIAPILAQARKATTVSGRLGRNATTRSPLLTPIVRSASASEATCLSSSAQEISCSLPFSSANRMAGLALLAWRKT